MVHVICVSMHGAHCRPPSNPRRFHLYIPQHVPSYTHKCHSLLKTFLHVALFSLVSPPLYNPPPYPKPLPYPQTLLNILLSLSLLLPFTKSLSKKKEKKMIQSLNPHNNNNNEAKTVEILSRYRPIAPKPEMPLGEGSSGASQIKFRQSPYLSNVWAHLQARPTRTRKRGRTSLAPSTIKRQMSRLLPLITSPPPSNISLSMLGSSHGLTALPKLALPGFRFPSPQTLIPAQAQAHTQAQAQAQAHSNLVTLPLLPCPFDGKKGSSSSSDIIDLNDDDVEIIREEDFLGKLEDGPTFCNVIAPQPIRPVGSSISVGSISEDPNPGNPGARVPKKVVEEEVELESLPAVVSDSNNKVRMANSAYKEMVGQPECSWLDLMVSGGACKRISGEVMLRFSDSDVPVSANGFSCRVKIEWGSDDKKNSVDAFSDVIRLSCESKDYLFAWRFHTREASAGPGSNSA